MPTQEVCIVPTKPDNFRLPRERLGISRLDTGPDKPGSHDIVGVLLQQNHDKHHMYFRDIAGHNHIPHAILTTMAMGGTVKELRRAYDDGEAIQRPKTAPDPIAVGEMEDPFKFLDRMQEIEEYSNFIAFFKKEFEANQGQWQDVFNHFVFARNPQSDFLLAQMFEGLYHPLIHLSFGVEFELSGLVAEGLAQAASHDTMYIDVFFQRTEVLVKKGQVASKPLMDIYRELRANEAVRTAALLSDGPWKVRDGVLGRSMEDMIHLAAQIQVPATEEAVGRAIAEMISCAAATCGGVHPLPDKERKIDFFLLHNVTASLSLSVLNQQPWIKIEDKARLIEYKARLDLVWYAGSAAPEVDLEQHLVGYVPAPDAVNSRGTNWQTLYAAVNQHHDDGHVAKFVRACRNGEEATAPYEKLAETLDWLPVHGDLWLKLAQLCYDTTYQYADGQKKWVWGTGFAAMWENVRDTK